MIEAPKGSLNLPEMERSILSWWKEFKIFEQSLAAQRGHKKYTFYDGPPFANGLPHYGHLLANTVKDIVPRYWTMRGFHVDRRFGWDCHGFPVEVEIEKKHGLKGRPDILAMGIATFNELCRESVLHYASEWQKTITRLGRWVDWDNQYRTMDPQFMESVWWVLKELDQKGLFYKGHNVVSYSPQLSAVLSNFEANLNYKDVQDPAVTVLFKIVDEDAYLAAWTTTPWTLVSNLALAVGPDIIYWKVEDIESGQQVYLARERVEQVFKPQKDGTSSFKKIEEVAAQKLVGCKYHPIFPYYKDRSPAFVVIAADYVTTDEGTGIVHLAPAFGEDDFRVSVQNGIEPVDPLDSEARFTADVPEYEGQFVKDADKQIIRDLKTKGALLRHEVIVHSYPHCERTDGPLIYRMIPSWYIRVEQFRDQLVRNNQTINWVPEHLREGRMGKWLENARDWAISRNRFWGTPLPVWVCQDETHPYRVVGSVAELQELSGEVFTDLHRHFIDHIKIPCIECGQPTRRVPEVFDCWFESGSMPYAQLHYPFENKESFEDQFPADFIAEGLDQTRGWFYTLSILSQALFEKPAFKNVVVNGLVLAADGRKMSKRLGNYTPPLDLLDQFGSDSVRLYMISSAILKGEPLRFTDEGVKETTRSVLLPLWNAFSFLATYAEADGWQPQASLATGVAPSPKHDLDLWILSRLQSCAARVHERMQDYKLYAVVPEVLSFIDELTNWYIRLSRRRFWGTSDQNVTGPMNSDAFETLYFVMLQFSKLFAPFAPFISEKIYRSLVNDIAGAKESVHLCEMALADIKWINKDLEDRMQLVRKAANLGRSLRAKHQIKTRQVLQEMLIITSNNDDARYISESDALLKEELNVKNVTFSSDESKYVRLTVKPNLKTLGKRLGAKLGAFRKELDEMNASHERIAQLLSQLRLHGSVTIAGESLAETDFLIDRGPKGERLVASEDGITVLLDLQLTDELRREGLARELINRIQNMRKDSGLNVSDRIKVVFSASDQLQQAAAEHASYISSEVLAISMTQWTDESLPDYQASFEFDDHCCKIGLSRADRSD